MAQQDEYGLAAAAGRGAELAELGPMGISRTQAGAHVALKVPLPRDEAKIERRALKTARKMGELAYYAWSTKNKDGTRGRVEGATVKLAMELYRQWCNATLDLDLVSADPEAFVIRATFVDLETGASFPSLFKQRRRRNARGRMDADRQDDIDLQIGCSKAMRNAILRGMPEWLIRDCIDAAKTSEAEGARQSGGETITARKRGEMVDAWRGLGVTVDMLERRWGRLDALTPEGYAESRGVYRAIREGQSSVDNEFSWDDSGTTGYESEPAETETTAPEGQLFEMGDVAPPESGHPSDMDVPEREPGEEG